MRTEGSIALKNCDAPRHEIASACGVSLATVSYWATGKKRPSSHSRTVLEERFAIKSGLWERIAALVSTPEPKRVVSRADRAARRALRLMNQAQNALSDFVRLQSDKLRK